MKKTLRISFEGRTYEVVAEVLDDEASAASSPAPAPTAAASLASAGSPVSAGAPGAAGPGDVPSPLAGKVVSIEAGPGTRVKAGAPVLTLEAMKMNTVVSAPIDGVVATVHVKPGDVVEEGRLLLSIR